jgi:hypothetical protein
MGRRGGVVEINVRGGAIIKTLLFSATLTRSLESLQEMAGAGLGRLPLTKFVLNENCAADASEKSIEKEKKNGEDNDDDDSSSSSSSSEDISGSNVEEEDEEDDDTTNQALIPNIPPGLRQEYIFMPSHVRDAYLVTAVRNLMVNGGRKGGDGVDRSDASGWNDTTTITGGQDDFFR